MKRKWIQKCGVDDKRLPIPTQIVSTGEFAPVDQTEGQRRVEQRLIEIASESSKKLGLSRRRHAAVEYAVRLDKSLMKLIYKFGVHFLLLLLAANSLCVSAQKKKKGMVLISGATFEMGTEKAEIPRLREIFKVNRAELFAEETPRRKVGLNSFYIDETEVTNAAFKKFTDKNPAWRKAKIAPDFHNGKYLQDWRGANFPAGKARFPVAFVSWYAAVAYCRSLDKRLPTEAEWEYAARGGLAGKQFPWGDEMPDERRANFGASKLGAPVKVASYAPNGYGLFDMAGNVWEFLADEWSKYAETSETLINPVAGGDLFDGDSYRAVKTRRALRGGSFGGSAINLRVAYRDSHQPENAVEHVGFRCAQTAR
jgi:formylglycine-generating enzyme required for sulfatase activity